MSDTNVQSQINLFSDESDDEEAPLADHSTEDKITSPPQCKVGESETIADGQKHLQKYCGRTRGTLILFQPIVAPPM